MKTVIQTLGNTDLDLSKYQYTYQSDLTPYLDSLDEDFDQNIINEIMLWKINRYAAPEAEALMMLNSIKKSDDILDEDITRELLHKLLNTKGIRLPVASTLLRFRNPNLYQIIDQRAYRQVYGQEYKEPNKLNDKIDLYLEYLNRLRDLCLQKNIEFSQSDRILYWADIVLNRNNNIKY